MVQERETSEPSDVEPGAKERVGPRSRTVGSQIAVRLKRAADLAEVNLTDLASAMETSTKTLRLYLRGERLMLGPQIMFAAQALGLHPSEILSGTKGADTEAISIREDADSTPAGSWPVQTTTLAAWGVTADELFAVRVSGDEMTPEVRPGDLCVVRLADSPRSGKLNVVERAGQYLVRRVAITTDGVVLTCENREKYSERDSLGSNDKIAGVVIAVFRNL